MQNESIDLEEIPPGWEIYSHTIRRVRDGALRTILYRPINSIPVSAVPIVAPLSNLQLHQDYESSQVSTHTTSASLVPYHLHNLPIRHKNGDQTRLNSNVQGLSTKTQERYANSRGDGYTIACGVESPEIATPVRKVNLGNGKYRCPRCKSDFTREKTVKDHFPDCISKHGNSERLSFTDHPSMKRQSNFIQTKQLHQNIRESELARFRATNGLNATVSSSSSRRYST